MVKRIKSICFALKSQEHNPKIREGNLVGIAIKTWRDYVWSSCGYLMVPNDPEAIQNLEKNRKQDHFFYLTAEMRVEDFTEDVISDEGKKLGTIGKKKVYVEDPDWGKKIKLLYIYWIKYFVPKKVIKNENNLLHVEIEPMEFYHEGMVDKLIFKGEKINRYRDLVAGNLGKEFKMSQPILDTPPEIDTNRWNEKDKIELSEEKKTNGRPEKTIPEIKQSLENYYQKNDIKIVKLSDEDEEFLDIIFNSGKKKSSSDFLDRYDKQKFEQVKIILNSNNKRSLDYSELTSITVSDPNFAKQKELLKKWMEENEIEEIILKKRNIVLCKKRNGGDSVYFGSELVGSEEIPENLRTKINGVDIGRFFEKLGKDSISKQELNISESEKEAKNKDNLSRTLWLIGGGGVVLVGVVGFWFFFSRRKRREKRDKIS